MLKFLIQQKNKQTNKNSLWNTLFVWWWVLPGHEAKGSTQGETVRSAEWMGHEKTSKDEEKNENEVFLLTSFSDQL